MTWKMKILFRLFPMPRLRNGWKKISLCLNAHSVILKKCIIIVGGHCVSISRRLPSDMVWPSFWFSVLIRISITWLPVLSDIIFMKVVGCVIRNIWIRLSIHGIVAMMEDRWRRWISSVHGMQMLYWHAIWWMAIKISCWIWRRIWKRNISVGNVPTVWRTDCIGRGMYRMAWRNPSVAAEKRNMPVRRLTAICMVMQKPFR